MIDLSEQFIGKAAALLPLYFDDGTTDILINGTGSLFTETEGALIRVSNPFEKPSELADFIERLLVPIGKRIDASQPYLDGRLVDGSRFHIMLPPIGVGGPYISIRKQRRSLSITLNDFAAPDTILHLERAIEARRNILVCGSTGSGKTTILGRLVDKVNPDERITVIEETLELQSWHHHLVRLEARPPTPDGVGQITQRTLLKNALRMRPDRLVLGECRGEESFDLLQALNTGHSGSMGTIHANSSLDALRRLESLVLLTGFDVNPRVIRSWIASAIHTVVHLEKRRDRRQIREILDISGLEGDAYRVNPIFKSG